MGVLDLTHTGLERSQKGVSTVIKRWMISSTLFPGVADAAMDYKLEEMRPNKLVNYTLGKNKFKKGHSFIIEALEQNEIDEKGV